MLYLELSKIKFHLDLIKKKRLKQLPSESISCITELYCLLTLESSNCITRPKKLNFIASQVVVVEIACEVYFFFKMFGTVAETASRSIC